MKNDQDTWVVILGGLLMIAAATMVDWRAGAFVAGLLLWADFR